MKRKLTFLTLAVFGSSDVVSFARRESSDPAGFRRGPALTAEATGVELSTGFVHPRS